MVLDDDRKISGVGCYEGVELRLQGLSMSLNFLPFPLGGVDVIFEVKWLKQLGEVEIIFV